MLDFPEYYSGIRPFKQLFRKGLPILTYHKIGPRPRGARLKGLYLGEHAFRNHLKELKSNGFHFASPEDVRSVKAPNDRVVITFDDAYENVFRYALSALKEEKGKAVLFVIAGMIGQTNTWDAALGEAEERLMDEVQIREWLQEGQLIGSHTLSHSHLSRLSPQEVKNEVYRSKALLEDKFGVPVNHFCYPYGDLSPAVAECVRETGYQTACTVERGVNFDSTDPWMLKRWTARYPSRKLKNYWLRFRWFLRDIFQG